MGRPPHFATLCFAKVLFVFTFLLLTTGIFSGCDNEMPPPPQSSSINKILPLGASRVEGARPNFESYRYELWLQLTADNWEFDFIGTRQDNATYPDLSGRAFDPDHEGRGGWTADEIDNNLAEWLQVTGAPDVVLFSSPGGNDILNGTATIAEIMTDVNAIIDLLQSVNPKVTILIEQLAPGRSDFMTAEYLTAFRALQQEVLSITNQQSTSTSRVIAIDMHTGFTDEFLADEVHYNEAGARFIADRYYQVLQDILE